MSFSSFSPFSCGNCCSTLCTKGFLFFVCIHTIFSLTTKRHHQRNSGFQEFYRTKHWNYPNQNNLNIGMHFHTKSVVCLSFYSHIQHGKPYTVVPSCMSQNKTAYTEDALRFWSSLSFSTFSQKAFTLSCIKSLLWPFTQKLH